MRKLLLLLLLLPGFAWGQISSTQGDLRVELMADGFEEPWGLTFIPDGFLVTERDGRLTFVGERRIRVRGLPKVRARGQGGLLDIVAARDFASTREVFFTYSKPGPGGAGTALAVARLSPGNDRLTDWRDLFIMSPLTRARQHFGSRVVEGGDGYLYVSIGDRGDRPEAQNTRNHIGTIIRVARDGTIPDDNPGFARPEIWSYGHRNPQGAALDATGRLWAVEHGARGGDEINLIQKGRNYGWPVIAYGRHYSGAKIGVGTHKEGMEQPAYYWDPSIAPSGMMIYSGRLWPAWEGDIFVGSLKFDNITRVDRQGTELTDGEILASAETGRVRDVREAPDGSIWFLSVTRGAVYRISR